MRRVACRFRLLPGMREEYKRRHDNLWPEMAEAMREAGIKNYTIWRSGDDLFGYYEVDDYDRSVRILSQSEVVRRWNDGMKDIVEKDVSPETGLMKEMELTFLFNG